MVRSEGNMSLKNPVTPSGIDPGTVQLVAQRLNHYATPGPQRCHVDNGKVRPQGFFFWSESHDLFNPPPPA
jgi:hypothetical protein